jgi:hypothetical protein
MIKPEKIHELFHPLGVCEPQVIGVVEEKAKEVAKRYFQITVPGQVSTEIKRISDSSPLYVAINLCTS